MIKQSKSSNLAKCAIAVVLACVSARICIPIATMPITFQTAVCVLISLILGSKYIILVLLITLLVKFIEKLFARSDRNMSGDTSKKKRKARCNHE